MIGQPVVYKEVCTIGTQTDDNGYNGLDDGGREDESKDLEEIDAILILEDANSFDEDSSEATIYSVSNQDIIVNIDNVLQEGDENDFTHLEELGNNRKIEANNNSVDNNDRDFNVDSFLQEGERNHTKNSVELKSENNNETTEKLVQVNMQRHSILPSGENNLHLKNTLKRKSGVNCHPVTNVREKECSYCRKKFALKKDLTRHLRTHTGERPFECSNCKRKFTLKHHMIDYSRKPFEFSYCKKKFARKDILTYHLKTHTGEKPFQCSYCKKKFIRHAELTHHLKTHTSEKLFECSSMYCEKKFSRKESLKFHVQNHTEEAI
ncbi:zinc finger protein 605 [Exaiptasia diaphana]|uniref:C2H2-type domain-containing protein n=1 Tax=Exaiptasia diaphana TaxID=2652724 RepID=A0A913WXH8_EXADI|nr:zinc finger protein 605 [Exaiptasia diaphana]